MFVRLKKNYMERDKYSFSLFSWIHFWIAHLFIYLVISFSFVDFFFYFSFSFISLVLLLLLLLSLPTSSSTMMCFCFCSSPLIITIYVLSVAVMRYAFLLLLRFCSFSSFRYALVCEHTRISYRLVFLFCFVLFVVVISVTFHSHWSES